VGFLDAWSEEDEQVFVHARDPYTRVDALRSTRSVRVELEGVGLAESSAPVMVFETGLPTRYYLNRTEVDFTHLAPTNTLTACPYKGTTSGYWTAHLGDTSYSDIAWTYDFPTRQLLPIAGLIALYNEKVDTFLDGHLLDRLRDVRRTPGPRQASRGTSSRPCSSVGVDPVWADEHGGAAFLGHGPTKPAYLLVVGLNCLLCLHA